MEEELIKAAYLQDEDAFCELFSRYRPLFNSIKNHFYIRDYDDQDWEQDAMIICHDTIQHYDAKKGSFASLYKFNLQHHAIALIRHRHALRRKANEIAVPIAHFSAEKIPGKTVMVHSERIADLLYGKNFLKSLSKAELAALQTYTGKYTVSEAAEKYALKADVIERARYRVRRKIVMALQ